MFHSANVSHSVHGPMPWSGVLFLSREAFPASPRPKENASTPSSQNGQGKSDRKKISQSSIATVNDSSVNRAFDAKQHNCISLPTHFQPKSPLPEHDRKALLTKRTKLCFERIPAPNASHVLLRANSRRYGEAQIEWRRQQRPPRLEAVKSCGTFSIVEANCGLRMRFA